MHAVDKNSRDTNSLKAKNSHVAGKTGKYIFCGHPDSTTDESPHLMKTVKKSAQLRA